jgi:ribulose-5-phosphate 4-epimerase/fuculose-1-phosphate aldolase
VGETVGAAFAWMHRTEMACQYQVDALAGGVRLQIPPPEVRERTREQGLRIFGPNGHARSGFEWPGLLRQLERTRGTSYRT